MRERRPSSHPVADPSGSTLVELLVGLLVGLFLAAAAMLVYLDGKRAWTARDNVAHLEESGRLALNQLREDIRLAGFWGINLPPHELTTAETIAPTGDCAPGWALDIPTPLARSNNTSAGMEGCIERKDHQPGTDVLTVRRSSSEAVQAGSIEKDGVYLLASLTEGRIFQADGDAAMDTDIRLARAPTALYAVKAHAYYVRAYSSTPGDGVPTLVRETLGAGRVTAVPLVEFIEDLQITFGLDLDGDGSVDAYDRDDTYPANDGRVISVIVELLARSPKPEPAYSNTRTYRLGDRERTFDDRFRRRLFRDAVFVRNGTGGPAA